MDCSLRPRPWGTLAVALFAAVNGGCHYMRTTYALEQLNKPSQPSGPVRKVDVPTRVARLTRDQLVDAYIEPKRVVDWLSAVERNPKPILDMLDCLKRTESLGDPTECYQQFSKAVLPPPQKKGSQLDFGTSAWGLPAAPLEIEPPRKSGAAASGAAPGDVTMTRLVDPTTAEAAAELDAQRFTANARALPSSLLALQHAVGSRLSDADLKSGLATGLGSARSYLGARRWHRDVKRPPTAMILSGGAANGAFSAGIIWRLFEVLGSCRTASAADGCPGAKVDLVAGTSTGALLGVIVDLFAVPNFQTQAESLLLDSYTCSVESDLYCAIDTWDWNLAKDVRGLVRFDGIRKKLEENMRPEIQSNDLELITVTVDFESGDIYAQSDQDPMDPTTDKGRVDSVLASIVEPVMAEPVDGLSGGADGKTIAGTFIDGGIRSGLPMMEAVRRGAARVLVISNSGIEPGRSARPPSAVSILFRTLDLMVYQPRVGEVQQGEFAAVARRLGEYNVCKDRLRAVSDSSKMQGFCQRRTGFGPPRVGPEAAVSSFVGPQLFEEVAESWKTTWIYRPEEEIVGADGYAFKPEVMRPLFLQGVRTFQSRCKEIIRLFSIQGSIASKACSEAGEAAAARAEAKFKPIADCKRGKEEMRICQ